MASKMKSTFTSMLMTLLIISAIAALSLGVVYNTTKEPIAKAQQQKLTKAIADVLPPFETQKMVKVPDADGPDSIVCYVGYKGEEPQGIAIDTYTMKGFSGKIRLMVGFDMDGNLVKTAVLAHKETPGLGDKMVASKSDFPKQFWHKAAASLLEKGKFLVKKDGGKIDAITAATISSRAFCDAVQRAYDTYNANKLEIVGGTK